MQIQTYKSMAECPWNSYGSWWWGELIAVTRRGNDGWQHPSVPVGSVTKGYPKGSSLRAAAVAAGILAE